MINNVISKKAYVWSLGCPMRDTDMLKIKSFFQKNNMTIAGSIDEADIAVLVTCGLNISTINNSIKTIDSVKNKGIKIIVTGCLPEIAPSKISTDENIHIIPISQIETIGNFFDDIDFKYADIKDANLVNDYNNLPEKDSVPSFGKLFSGFSFSRTFYFRYLQRHYLYKFYKSLNKDEIFEKINIRISNGCLFNCSFCGIKNAIGKLKSKPVSECESEYQNLLNSGYRNFVFLGDETGAYGLDINSNLPELFKSLSSHDINRRIIWSLQDLNPHWALKYEKELFGFIKDRKLFDINITLQSGSNKILKLMNRQYDINSVVNTLNKFRICNPVLKINTNFIIGFPSETEEDFNASLMLTKNFNFDFVYLMPYYENEVCDAREIQPKVSPEIIKQRVSVFSDFLLKKKVPFKIVE